MSHRSPIFELHQNDPLTAVIVTNNSSNCFNLLLDGVLTVSNSIKDIILGLLALCVYAVREIMFCIKVDLTVRLKGSECLILKPGLYLLRNMLNSRIHYN